MKHSYSYLGIAALVASTYAIIGAQAQWMENGQECHMDVSEVTVCAPSPSPTPPSGGGDYYGGGGQQGSGPGNSGYSGPVGGNNGGGGGSSNLQNASVEEILRYIEQHAPEPYMGYPLMPFLPQITAVVYCYRAAWSATPFAWRVYVAFGQEDALDAQAACRMTDGIPTIIWGHTHN